MGNSLEKSQLNRKKMRGDQSPEPRTIELHDLLVSNFEATK